jgi:hypothetical protein
MKSDRLRQFKRSGVVVVSALCLVVGTAAASLAAGPPGRAHAGHPARQGSLPVGMSWRVYHLMLAQAPLDAAATRIQALAARPGPAHAGFFQTEVEAGRHTLTVYWHGPVPGNVQRLISGLRAKVAIRVVQTRYSLATLNRDVLAAIRSHTGVVGGYPMSDGSGVVLGVRSPDARYAASVASALRSRFGVSVMATPAGQDQPQYCVFASGDPLGAGSRCDDLGAAPGEAFWGGDVIQQTSNGVTYGCTGTFGVHNSSGGEYLLTAAHCADNGSGYVNGITFHNGQDSAHWQRVGQITDVPGPHDAAVIPASSGNQYYDGPGIYNGDTYRTKTVSGQLAVSVHDNYCESGAFGGVLCNFTVQQTNVSLQDPNFPSLTWTALAIATSGSGNFTIGGDSGGPWFSLNGSTHVWARAIHHGLWFNNGTEYEVFTPVTVASNDMGVWVNTG